MNKRHFIKGVLATPALLQSSFSISDIIPNESAPECTLTPEQIEGPFFLDTRLIRKNIREEQLGRLLVFVLKVVDQDCRSIPNAVVELWHGNALGHYSGFDGQGQDQSTNLEGTTFLRGSQITNDLGLCTFFTIFPGHYPGRATHFHIKILVNSSELLTTQLYFPDTLKESIYKELPYSENTAAMTTNSEDQFIQSGLEVAYQKNAFPEDTDLAYKVIGVQRIS